jgi:hypothetical protein
MADGYPVLTSNPGSQRFTQSLLRGMRIGMRVLNVDVGGTNVKVLATGQTEPRRFPSAGIGQLWSRIILGAGGSGLISKPHSDVP